MRWVLAALAAVGISVATIGVALHGSNGQARSAKLTISSALPAGSASTASVGGSSMVPRMQIAHGTLTPAVRDMPKKTGHWNVMFKKVAEHSRTESVKAPDRHQGSALVQRGAPKNQMPSPIVNFDGVNNVSGASPPDTEGEVGPNHYMQWVNLAFRIYNKDGTPAGNITQGYQLFAGKPHCGAASGNGGDPVVMYDQFSQRWLATQLAYPTYPAGPFYQCVAYSSTSDPTGTWCAYEFVASPTNLNDYPKFGVWPTQHAYMITVNQFAEPGDNWAGVGVFALERDAMMSGCGSARMLYKNMFTEDPNLWGGMLPADLDGSAMPPANAPAPLIEVDDDAWGYPQDRLDVWNATVDWSGAGTINVSHEGALPVAPFDYNLGSGIAQPGTSTRLDTLNDRLMFRMAYRNFGDHQAMVVNHSVDSDGADHAGVRWYELRRTSGNWSIFQQGTYEPDTTVSRWMGSAAMDQNGDMAVGFSTSAGTAGNYPSVRYAGRLATDPVGQLSQGETVLRPVPAPRRERTAGATTPT